MYVVLLPVYSECRCGTFSSGDVISRECKMTLQAYDFSFK